MTMSFYSALVALLLQPAPPSFIEGTVVDAASGAPLSQATLTVRYDKAPDGSNRLTSQNTIGNNTKTATDGRFRIEVLPGIPFHFAVTRDGYTSIGESFGHTDPNAHTLQPGKDKTGVVVRLNPESSLAGLVYDPELQKPVPGITVRAMLKTRSSGNIYWAPTQQGKTGADGRYRISGLAPGEYRLFFSSNLAPKAVPAMPQRSAPVLDYPDLFFPGVADSPSAVAVNLMSGASLDSLDLKTTRKPLFSIRGEVIMDGPSESVALFSITPFTDDGEAHRRLGVLPAPGPFEVLNLPAGPIKLSAASIPKDPAQRRMALVETTVFEHIKDVRLQLMPGAQVTFAITSYGLKDGARDPLWNDLAAERRIEFGPRARTRMGEDPSAKAGPDGRGSIENVFVEPVMVSIRPIPEGWVLRLLLYNGQPVESYRVDMNPAAPEHHFQALLAPAPNSITGEVRVGSKPAPQAMVLAVREPFDKTSILFRSKRATAGDDGRYSLRTLIPGSWRILAVPASESWQRAQELILAGVGAKQDVPESGTVTLRLDAGR